jgi:hypothetical protein
MFERQESALLVVFVYDGRTATAGSFFLIDIAYGPVNHPRAFSRPVNLIRD